MFSYRVTKYNPEFRNDSGFYIKKDWTSIADIGTLYDGNKLRFEDYQEIENKYVQAIIIIMNFLDLDSLTVKGLEKYNLLPINERYCSKEMLNIFNIISNGQIINKNEISTISKLVLREDLWCKFESKKMFVHFSYDYYMYIGSLVRLPDSIIKKVEFSGLFLEETESPYQDEIKAEFNTYSESH